MPERSFNSPSDNQPKQVQVVSIRKRGAGGRTREVTLADGSSFFVLRELADELGLREGEPCDLAELEKCAARSGYRLTYERALSLLARREHSRKQLADKLARREHDGETVRAVLDELAAAGKLSDRRFAEQWLEGRLRRSPCGKSTLHAGLMQRGVSRELSEAAIESVSERAPELFDGAAARALTRLMRSDRDPLSLQRKLSRRGFSAQEIRRALEQHRYSDED